MVVYLFSGLGADERAYSDIFVKKFQVKHIQWIIPEEKETLSHYAKRLSYQINELPCIFIGLSFGGIMAIEVSKYIKPIKLILISSAKTDNEIPFYFKWFKKIKLYKFISDNQLIRPNVIINYMFGISNTKNKKLLSDIIKDSNPLFVRWAIEKIITWNHKDVSKNIIHIHGRKDRIFPIRFSNPDMIIDKGGHFMIMEQAKELEKLINELMERF